MNIFIDCGFYIGDALKKYLDQVDDTWTIYAFEPSPLIDCKEVIKTFGLNIKLIKKAVWTKDGEVPFWTSERHNASHVEDTTGNAPDERMMVKSVDFSKFLSKLPEDANIICSMDIEGSEYPVLEKMLKDGTASRINLLDIEFHHRFMIDFSEVESQKLIDELEAVGVKIKLKVPLI